MDRQQVQDSIFDAVRDGLWALDATGATLLVNDPLPRLLRISPTAFAGPDRLRAADLLHDGHLAWLRRRLSDLSSDDEEHQIVVTPPGGPGRWMWVRATRLTDADGEPYGIVLRLAPGTQATHLSETQQMARIAGWSLDMRAGVVTRSPELIELFDLDPATVFLDLPAMFRFIHPADRELASRRIGEVMAGVVDETEIDVRRLGLTRVTWTRIRAVARRDGDGNVVEVIGTDTDITDTKRLELDLAERVLFQTAMHEVAAAANRADKVEELLAALRVTLLEQDDWQRAGLRLLEDGVLVPVDPDGEWHARGLHGAERDRRDDKLARECVTRGATVWDDDEHTIATPIHHAGTLAGVLLLTPTPPVRYELMIDLLAETIARQMGQVVERQRASQELAAARDAAVSASAQKSAFLAVMSHEVRTPLNGVIGLGELLLQTPLTDEQRRLADGIHQAGQTLLHLVSSTLDLTKLEAGKLRLEQTDFELRPLVDRLVSLHQAEVADQPVTLAAHVGESVPDWVRGDPTRLTQVLTNLVGNAVKFTDEGEVTLDVAAVAQGRSIELGLVVSDSGPGIAPERLPRLFEPFEQGDVSTTRLYGGTGLGLTISRDLIAAMGGTLHYAPRVGGGSIFSFSVRLAVPGEEPVPEPAGATATRPRVLVAEDNDVNQLVARGLLTAIGCDVAIAADGREAVDLCAGEVFDLVFMDVQMPVMDGYAATAAIRATDGPNRQVPIVALTASATDDVKAACLAAGMSDFLTKPLDRAALATVVEEWMAVPSEARLDADRLRMLAGFDEEAPQFLRRAIERFAANADGATSSLTTLLRGGDHDGVRREAHKLLGAALNLGLHASSALLRELEQAAGEDTERAAEILQRLGPELEHDVEELRRYRTE